MTIYGAKSRFKQYFNNLSENMIFNEMNDKENSQFVVQLIFISKSIFNGYQA